MTKQLGNVSNLSQRNLRELMEHPVFLSVAFAEEEGCRGAEEGAGEEVCREEEGHRPEVRTAQEPRQHRHR